MENEDKRHVGLAAPEGWVVFEPDIIQQEQWDDLYKAARDGVCQCPEHGLYLAVLEDAVHAIFTARTRKALEDVRKWLARPDRDDVRFNLRTVCDVLNVDCSAVQEKLLPHVLRRMGHGGNGDDEEDPSGGVALSGLVRKRQRST